MFRSSAAILFGIGSVLGGPGGAYAAEAAVEPSALPERAARVLGQAEGDIGKLRERALAELERIRREEMRAGRSQSLAPLDRKIDELRTLLLLPHDLLGDGTQDPSVLVSLAKQARLFSRPLGAADPLDRLAAEVRIGTRMAMGGRGLTVLAIAPDGTVLISKTYDLLARKNVVSAFAEDILALRQGAIVGIALYEGGASAFNAEATLAIQSLGGASGLMGAPYASGYVLLGIKGLPPGSAIERRSDGERVEYPPAGQVPKGPAPPGEAPRRERGTGR